MVRRRALLAYEMEFVSHLTIRAHPPTSFARLEGILHNWRYRGEVYQLYKREGDHFPGHSPEVRDTFEQSPPPPSGFRIGPDYFYPIDG